MSNTNLNLVEYDVAFALRNLGFNYWTQYYFDKDKKLKQGEWSGYNEREDTLAVPNCFVVRQWLRNEFDIDVFVCRLSNITIPNLGYGFIVYTPDDTEPIILQTPYETYELAEYSAVIYVLKNLIIKQEDNNEEQ